MTKDTILKELYTAEGKTVSGPSLSRHLTISRVAVWKHIQGLKQAGWPIESTARGYRLRHSDDLLHPFCFGSREKTIHHFFKISSTMDEARRIARKGAPHLSVVVAEHQTAGRGRLNRKWLSDAGGLWFTVILRPELPPPLTFKLNFAASLSLASVLNTLFRINAAVKWPNDIMVPERKIAGLLSEMETQGEMTAFVNIGIGLNVNNAPERSEPSAASIGNILGRPVSRQQILSAFLDTFEKEISGLDSTDIVAKWKGVTSTIGKRVTVATHDRIFEGIATDVDETGALLLRTGDGAIERVIYGDCFYGEKGS